MQLDDMTSRYLRQIRFALWVLAAAGLLIAIASVSLVGSVVYDMFESKIASDSIISPSAEPPSSSPCSVDTYFQETSKLMEKAKYKDVVVAADARLNKCPSDHYAYWFKGKALALEGEWKPALEALNHAELLRPDWRRLYIQPLRESIESQQSEKK